LADLEQALVDQAAEIRGARTQLETHDALSGADGGIGGIEGKRLLLQNLSILGNQDDASRWTLYTPDNHRLASAYLHYQYAAYNNLPALLPSTGSYTLVVSGGEALLSVRSVDTD
jgi:hypothetical protein